MIVTPAIVKELLAFSAGYGIPHTVVAGRYDYSELRKFGRDHLHMNMDEASLRQGLLGVIFDTEVRSASPVDRHLSVRDKDGAALAHVLGHGPDGRLVRPATLHELHAGDPASCRECLVWSVMND